MGTTRFVVWIACIVSPLLAQTLPGDSMGPSGLAHYARILVMENPAIRAAHAQWQSEIAKTNVVGGLPDPSLSLGYFIENIETAVGPQEYKLGLRQMIPWPGKLSVQKVMQSEKAQAAFHALQAEIQGRLLSLTTHYYEAYLLERSIAVTEQNLAWVKQWEAVSLSRYRSAEARHLQVIQAQIEALKLTDDLATLEGRRKPLLAAFRTLLGRTEMDHIVLPDTLPYVAEILDRPVLMEKMKSHNPDLARLDAISRAALKGIGRARMNSFPDFGIGVERIFTGDKLNAGGEPVPESGKDPWMISASVEIPLWFGRQKADADVAARTADAAHYRKKDRENTLHNEFEQIVFLLEDAVRKIRLYQDSLLPKVRESLAVSENAYASGEADFMNLVDAQRRLLQFQLAYETALVHYYQSRAALAALSGSLE